MRVRLRAASLPRGVGVSEVVDSRCCGCGPNTQRFLIRPLCPDRSGGGRYLSPSPEMGGVFDAVPFCAVGGFEHRGLDLGPRFCVADVCPVAGSVAGFGPGGSRSPAKMIPVVNWQDGGRSDFVDFHLFARLYRIHPFRVGCRTYCV